MAIATDLLEGTITLNGDLHGSVDGLAPELTPTGVVPGEYITPSVVVDEKGRMLYLQSTAFELPCAAIDSCGGVIPGENITFLSNTISVEIASLTNKGLVIIGSGFNLDDDVLNIDYPKATETTLGVVKVGQGLDVDISGNLSALITTLGDEFNGTLGSMQLGNGLDLNDGVANILNIDKTDVDMSELTFADVGGVLGVFSLGGNLTNVGGVVDVAIASPAEFGICKGDEVTMEVVAGVLQAIGGSPSPTADATVGSTGIMRIGEHLLDGGSGLVNVELADSNTTYGVVRSADVNNITITSGIMDVGSTISQLDSAHNWTAAQTSTLDLLSGTNITPDFSLSNVFELTLTGNTTINAPTNSSNGGTYIFIIKQDGVGSHTVTFNSVYKFNSVPTITPAVNAVDIVSIVRLSSTQYVSHHTTDFK